MLTENILPLEYITLRKQWFQLIRYGDVVKEFSYKEVS